MKATLGKGITEIWLNGHKRQPRLVLLDETIAKSIDEVVSYHYCYEKEDYETELERLNGDMYDHVFLDKQRVEEWLNENWFSEPNQNRFSEYSMYYAMLMFGVVFVVGWLLGIAMKH